MSFNSTVSRNQAHATVSKLFANILPESVKKEANKKSSKASNTPSTSSTQLLSSQFNQQTTKLQRKLDSKRQKKVNSVKMKKVKESNKKFSKHVKYNIIKNHSEHTVEEAKYLSRLQKKNVNQLLRLGEVDDMVINDEINELKNGLVEQITGSRNRRINKDHAFMENLKDSVLAGSRDHQLEAFNKRVEEGVLAVPGLTPGLAPVDYNDSDDE